MDGDTRDELHLEIAREVLRLSLVDLLHADHVGVDLPEDVRDAPEADLPVDASSSVDVVGGHANDFRCGRARAWVRPSRS